MNFKMHLKYCARLLVSRGYLSVVEDHLGSACVSTVPRSHEVIVKIESERDVLEQVSIMNALINNETLY